MPPHRTLLALLLAGLAGAQELDYPLQITRPPLVTVGGEAALNCALGAGLALAGDTCSWTTPAGATLVGDVATGAVTDASGAAADNYEAVGDAANCGLKIKSVKDEDLGQWSCNINEDQVPWHRGTFHLLDTGFVKDIRLPRHLQPEIYNVELFPHVEVGDFTTEGFMDFKFKVLTDPEYTDYHDKVVLHVRQIKVDESTVVVANSEGSANIIGHEYDLEREFYVIHLDEPMSDDAFLDEYSIQMSFTSILNDFLVGFYRSSYTNPVNGQTDYLGVTQFQPLDARRAFPCLDEPDLKARFDTKLTHKDTMQALSNMNVESTEPHPVLEGYTITTYEQSEKMSTYLVAFMVADFGVTVSDANPDFKIWHMKNKGDRAALAADCGPMILEYFEDYFGIDYPLPKTDMAAIPDFGAGAMENWGLITYRETNVLWDENESSLADRDRVIEVVAHELAHMWFGNLVTMKWWTDLWLNEGFATYVENIGKDAYDATLQSRDRAVLFDLHDVFEIDAVESSVAISSEVTNPDYDLVFGRISYGKGNCLIRMIENFITLDTFSKGINEYLTTFANDNAERSDLWNSFNAAAVEDGTIDAGLDVGTIMETWTTQAGYPVVTVTGVTGNTVTLSQKRFFYNPAADTPEMWYVPISVAYPDGDFTDTRPQSWFRDTDEAIDIDVAGLPYVLNVQESSYYRVNYDTANWDALTGAIAANPDSIHFLNRAQIYDDSLNLARASQLDYAVAMTLTKSLMDETNYIPLEAGLTGLSFVNKMLRDIDVSYSLLNSYMVGLLQKNYDNVGFENKPEDSYVDVLKRTTVINWTCLNGLEECISQALTTFKSWMDVEKPDETNPISPDLKQSIYQIAVREGTQTEFDFLLARLPNIQVDQDVKKVIYGLCSSTNKDNLSLLLEMTIDRESVIRSQDSRYVYIGIGSTSVGRRFQFDWLKDNYGRIRDYFGTANGVGAGFAATVEDMLDGFCSAANTAEEAQEVRDFLEEHIADLGSVAPAINSGIDNIEANAAWMQANYGAVVAWLESELGVTVPDTTGAEDSTTTVSTTPSGSSRLNALSAATILVVIVALFH